VPKEMTGSEAVARRRWDSIDLWVISRW
jgi:hypothetical protein